MTYRSYPSAVRARRQVARQASARPLSESEQRLARQGKAVLTAVGEATRPLQEALVQAGAPRSAPLAAQMLVVLGARLEEECARSAPGVLAMHRMAQAMRSR